MINPSKIPAALYAIHLVLIRARSLALEDGVDRERIYKILDWAEILPSLVTFREEDTTEEFRQMLVGLGEDFPECAGFLSNFDRGITWEQSRAS